MAGTSPAMTNLSFYGSAKTKIELCPRTAFGMLFWATLRGPAETD
jgi:hypothetical protein